MKPWERLLEEKAVGQIARWDPYQEGGGISAENR